MFLEVSVTPSAPRGQGGGEVLVMSGTGTGYILSFLEEAGTMTRPI